MANSVPTLTGLTTPVTFLENTVNATPQIIAADVTFNDADNNFNTGVLTVTGLLAQDTVAIRNQGTGAGQIGISGSDITFGGTVIGSFAGGAGSTLDGHLQRQRDGAGDRGADREPDLRQFLGHADREPQPRAQDHRCRRLRRHPAARVREADRRRQPGERPRCWDSSAATLADLDGDGDLDWSSATLLAVCVTTRTPARPSRRPSPFRTAPPIRSTASISVPRARRPSPTSTAMATSTPSSAQIRAPCTISRTPARPPRRSSPRYRPRQSVQPVGLAGLQRAELRRPRRRRRPRRPRRRQLQRCRQIFSGSSWN